MRYKTKTNRGTSRVESRGGVNPGLIGGTFETLVDTSLRQYERDGLLSWSPAYPEVRVLDFPKAVIVGKACPDRRVLLQGGRLCWLEIKTWRGKDRHTYALDKHPDRQNQYDTLARDAVLGAYSFYLVCWRWDGREDWRLYPVEGLERVNGGLVFNREEGLAVPSGDGWPDWYSAYRLVVNL